MQPSIMQAMIRFVWYSDIDQYLIDIYIKRIYEEQQNAVEEFDKQESSGNNQEENLDEHVCRWSKKSL